MSASSSDRGNGASSDAPRAEARGNGDRAGTHASAAARAGEDVPSDAGPDGDRFEIDDARREVLDRHARYIAEHHGRDVPLTARQMFAPPADVTPAQGIGLLAVMGMVVLSSVAGGRALNSLGVRGFALVMLVPAMVAAITMRGAPATASLSANERATLLAILAIAVLTGSELAIQLLPALVHAAVARLMMASLQGEESLIERTARVWHPLAPDFIRPYCRKLTVVWAWLFGISAAVSAALALIGWKQAWQAWCGWIFWSVLAAFVALEFVWRKAWFRYYGSGPLDRLLARVFPPQATARGRRSMAYMRLMREELARRAEAHRTSR
ncbi:MAG TPA: hypothetical protein VEC57_10465 [Candidatus Limnocylindrales bacterium]|nr:hypothetical protein [Candidatus Limnocylindrales bacterium]